MFISNHGQAFWILVANWSDTTGLLVTGDLVLSYYYLFALLIRLGWLWIARLVRSRSRRQLVVCWRLWRLIAICGTRMLAIVDSGKIRTFGIIRGSSRLLREWMTDWACLLPFRRLLNCWLRQLLLDLLRRLLHLLLELFDASFDPRVSECILRSHAFIRFPLQTVIDEINEVALVVIGLHKLRQLLWVYLPNLAFRVRLLKRSVIIIKEDLATWCDDDHRARWHSLYLHDALHLFFLILACENGEANEQLVQDTSKRPHVNSWSVADAHHDLRSAIESWLYVGIELVLLVSTWAKIYNFDTAFIAFA